jgi:glycosyltransferase involved in cell wall biosynthesis
MKVLFLTQTSELGPSSRYRVYQLLPLLRARGIECEVSPAIDSATYARLYLQGGAGKLSSWPAIWQRRRTDLQRLDEFDAVFVQKGVFPGLYSGFERKIAARKPLVYDLDDATWLPRQGGSLFLRALHRERTVHDILRMATVVTAGNEFLANYARRFTRSVVVVPSTVEVAQYRQNADSVVVGWIGSSTTLSYLKLLSIVFKTLKVTPRVIASGDPNVLGFPVDFRPWRPETESSELSQFGIGIAPLPNTPWEHGKCGVKLLQYMARGIPVIASPVGVHKQIVSHGVNGLLAETEADWISCLRQLLSDAALRVRLGAAAKETVTKRYDVRVAVDALAKVLAAITQTSGMTGKLNRKSA